MTASAPIGDMGGRPAGPVMPRAGGGTGPGCMPEDRPGWVDPTALGELVAEIGGDRFFDTLLGFIGRHVQIDNCVVLAFTSLGGPLVLHQWSPQEPNYFQMLYAQGAYQLDPFYLASLTEQRDGVHMLSEISPDDFVRSDFYETYYRKVQMIDEIGMLVPYDRHLTLHLSLGRRFSSRPYTEDDLSGIRFLAPLLRTVLLRHCGPLIEHQLHSQSTSAGAVASFATLLSDRWAESYGITMREAEVAAMVLRGHSNTSMSLVLAISVETVKVHRKNLYSKLRISSPTELFMLFIEQTKPMGVPPGALTG